MPVQTELRHRASLYDESQQFFEQGRLTLHNSNNATKGTPEEDTEE